MDRMVKTIVRRLFLLFACSIALVTLLAREFSLGVLSSHEFALGLLIVAVGMGVSALIIITKTARDLKVIAEPPGAPVDEATRKRRLLYIKAGKAMIALLIVSLVLGLFRGGPFVPVLVGAVMNVAMTASLVWWIIRLERTLK